MAKNSLGGKNPRDNARSGFALVRGAYVLVCDGAKAFILKNGGTPAAPDLQTIAEVHHTSRRTSEMGTDAPGRAFASVGTQRSNMEQTDWHAREETKFLDHLAAKLEKMRQAGEFDALVVVAPPHAMGELRRALSPRLRAITRAEVEKDYVNEPLPRLAQHLRAALHDLGK